MARLRSQNGLGQNITSLVSRKSCLILLLEGPLPYLLTRLPSELTHYKSILK